MKFKENSHYKQYSNQGEFFSFVHANAYTPDCYVPLLAPFFDTHSLISFKLRALWPDSTPTGVSSWMDFVADYDAFLTQKSIHSAIGMGHSIGAVMTILAELESPGRFKKIILLDPVLFPFSGALGVFIFKLIIGQLRFVRKTYQRQILFDSIESVYVHYRQKKIFKFIADDHLKLICESLFRKSGSGVELIQSPQWEAAIYKIGGICFPYFWKHVSQVKCPILLLAGKHTNICKEKQINQLVKKCSFFDYQVLPKSSHLLPFEEPLKAAEIIKEFLLS
tara:strand:- start:650 stop:1486 length:837 start_codon:yes stop_codon:yes gene_type:complete